MGRRRPRGRKSSPLSGKGALLAGVVVLALALLIGLNLQSLGSTTNAPSTEPTSAADLSIPIPAVNQAVGVTAPDFEVADAFGRPISLSSLMDQKPGLIFFTTTYCLPCIEGLGHFARFQQDVGPDAFNVLVVFVDPYETDEDLQRYQERFGFPQSWYYALDTDAMVQKYGVRSLDTKFVIDTNGVIQYADLFPANYETWQSALSTVGIAPQD